jgi:flagellar biosynthesis chaperone FliJ
MKPIRSNELNYLDNLIREKFRHRRQNIESEIEAATQKQTDKNYKSFVEKLGVKAHIKAFKEANDKLKKFQQQKESYESKLYATMTNKKIELEQKLQSWASIRGWKGNYDNILDVSIKDYDDVTSTLSRACKQETKTAVEKLPKFKVKHDLDLLEEQAKNVLYSGRDIKDVWKHLGQTFKTSGVPVAAPKEFLQLESK